MGETDDSSIDFSLPMVDKNYFADHVIGIVEKGINESLKSLYKLNSKTYNQDSLLKGPSFTKKIVSNIMPFVSRFFGLALTTPKPEPVKRVNIVTLKLDIDHIINLMKSELLTRNDLFEKSKFIHDNHHRKFMPTTKNKLFILTQMIWEIQDLDPYRQVNHLLENQLNDLVNHLKDPETKSEKFRLTFAEIFMIYYTQIVSGFDMIGKPSPYVIFITQYLSDIFNRIKAEMEGLVGLVTRDKTRLMTKVQGALINAYNFLKSNEPVILPNLPRLIKSSEVIGERFLKEYRSASEDEQKRFLASINLLRNMDKTSRNIKRTKFNPFILATKKNVLL